MLKLSRISRSIITVIYIIALCLVPFFAIKQNGGTSISVYSIVAYLLMEVFCICLYHVIKKRLRDKINNRTVRRVYRFSYFAVLVIVTRIIMIYITRNSLNYSYNNGGLASYFLRGLIGVTGEEKYAAVIINACITYINCVFIKKIILNVFENDAIATVSGTIYVLSPASLLNCLKFQPAMFNAMFVLAGTYLVFKIFEDITLYGDKSKIYLKKSVLLGIVVMLDILFGGKLICWIGIILGAWAITDYIAKEKFKIANSKILSKILTKVKKIRINKLLLVSAIMVILGLIGILILRMTNTVNNVFIHSGGDAGPFYMIYNILGITAIIFEILSLLLRRKCDSKIGMLKVIIIVFTIFSTIFIKSTVLFDAIFSIAFSVSICGMYYNREEKVKLLKIGN